jgi:mRNA interferase MazF
MASSDNLAAYDVVLVPFPFSDRLAEKRRPAIVISNPDHAARHGHVWLAMVTSARQGPWPTDVPVADIDLAGLPSASVVRTAKITTIEVGRVLRRLGALDGTAAAAVRQQIIDQLG